MKKKPKIHRIEINEESLKVLIVGLKIAETAYTLPEVVDLFGFTDEQHEEYSQVIPFLRKGLEVRLKGKKTKAPKTKTICFSLKREGEILDIISQFLTETKNTYLAHTSLALKASEIHHMIKNTPWDEWPGESSDSEDPGNTII